MQQKQLFKHFYVQKSILLAAYITDFHKSKYSDYNVSKIVLLD